MKINIFINRKIKDKDIILAINNYVKLICKFCRLGIFYSIDEDLLLSDTSYNINVCLDGRSIESEKLSMLFSSCMDNRVKNLNIVFEMYSCNFKDDICFVNFNMGSDFTYVMVLEQVYRSFKIINNEPYHK